MLKRRRNARCTAVADSVLMNSRTQKFFCCIVAILLSTDAAARLCARRALQRWYLKIQGLLFQMVCRSFTYQEIQTSEIESIFLNHSVLQTQQYDLYQDQYYTFFFPENYVTYRKSITTLVAKCIDLHCLFTVHLSREYSFIFRTRCTGNLILLHISTQGMLIIEILGHSTVCQCPVLITV